ncbi:hypothetical protein [Caldicoprobacter faecalis]|uniref:Uncharacterized protein n=1 Tax=Caldicoprobacter faecalis TaxID=937334 RepID=A0A1I5V9X7_9FIRM|nr:hypothetical protein [Caldicoprobacter faecalis]SFQ04384.1 hypothetical protein SAMN05444406_11057 [Caldicoprobacter faecalis]
MARNETVKNDNAVDNSAPGIDAELMSSMKEEVLRAKEENVPMLQAFEAVAKKSGLKVNTIRNYYYRYLHAQLVDNNESGGKRGKVRSLKGVAGKSFTEDEVKNLVMSILIAQAEGESVRSCANRLAGGDPKKMLRLQNKYRNVIASQREYVESLMAEMSQKGMRYFNPYTRQIVDGNSVPVFAEQGAGSKADTRSGTDTQPSGKDSLIGIIGDAVATLSTFDDFSVEGFFKGLKQLVDMAARGREKGDGDELTRLEKAYNELKSKLQELHDFVRQLAGINQRFVDLPDEQKLSALSDYINEVKAWLDTYEKVYKDA